VLLAFQEGISTTIGCGDGGAATGGEREVTRREMSGKRERDRDGHNGPLTHPDNTHSNACLIRTVLVCNFGQTTGPTFHNRR
jgi:hypothetical protein